MAASLFRRCGKSSPEHPRMATHFQREPWTRMWKSRALAAAVTRLVARGQVARPCRPVNNQDLTPPDGQSSAAIVTYCVTIPKGRLQIIQPVVRCFCPPRFTVDVDRRPRTMLAACMPPPTQVCGRVFTRSRITPLISRIHSQQDLPAARWVRPRFDATWINRARNTARPRRS